MINLGFTSSYEKEQIEKLSVIYEADSFVYGLFGKGNVLLKTGTKPYHLLDEFISKVKPEGASLHTLSKSRYFTHIPLAELQGPLARLPYRDKMSGEDIVTCYDSETVYLQGVNLKHFSTAIQHHYVFDTRDICHIHLGNSTASFCLCGKSGFKFYNEFDIQNAEDVIYYAQAVTKNFIPAETQPPVALSGLVEENSNLYKLLFRYLNPFGFANTYQFKTAQHEIGSHAFFDHYINISL
ncbi:MAG: DUF3822 family protein [Saprospiraceae bacterium]|nr:DUF3822 family protein [Saprospiraceae bacterium]